MQPGAYVAPFGGARGAERRRNIEITSTLPSDPMITDSPPMVAGSPPSRQCSDFDESARKRTHPSCIELPRGEIGRERRGERVAREGEAQERGDARDLVPDRLRDRLLATAARDVRVRRVELVRADPRVDERPPTVHVLDALGEAPSLPVAAAGWLVRAVECVREDRLRDVDVDPAEGVDELAEAVEVDDDDVVHREAVSARTVRIVRAGPPNWFAALTFEVPYPGISTRRSRGIERYERRCVPGSVRRRSSESERRASARPGAFPPSVPMTRIVAGSDSNDPSWRRLAERGRRPAREAPVRLVDAVREGEVAEDTPGDREEDEPDQGDADPERDAAATRRSRPRSGAGFDSGRELGSRGTLPLTRPPRYSR